MSSEATSKKIDENGAGAKLIADESESEEEGGRAKERGREVKRNSRVIGAAGAAIMGGGSSQPTSNYAKNQPAFITEIELGPAPQGETVSDSMPGETTWGNADDFLRESKSERARANE